MSEALRAQVTELLRDKYPDFGPTLAAEKLLELEGIKISREILRQMQVALGLWKSKIRHVERVFYLRERRPRFGELIQIDGSPHDWFEGRGPRCTLIVCVDDATSLLTALRLAPVESAPAYLKTLRCRCCNMAFRWRSTRFVMASSGLMPRTRRAALAKPSCVGSRHGWTSNSSKR